MFTPSNSIRAEENKTDRETQRKANNRSEALRHTVDLAKVAAAKWGSGGYSAEELLTYTASLAAYLDDGTVPTTPVAAKPKETDPAHAPGPETRDYLQPLPGTQTPLATPGPDIDLSKHFDAKINPDAAP